MAWERFEQFGHDLAGSLIGMRPETAHRYGTQGQTQCGIDVIVAHEDGSTWAFSNKRYKKYYASHVQAHIADATYPADHRVILISGIASPAVRDEIRKHSSWELWDAEDLSQKLRRDVSPDAAKRIVDHHFGPRWRNVVLGLPALCAFLPPSDHFRDLLNPDRLFHHSVPLVGRETVVSELIAFAGSPEKRIAVLQGRGGIGKTRILREFADRYDAAHPEHAVRLHNEGVPVTLESLDELPVAPCMIIVDDAHRLSDLGLLGAWLREHPASKLILGTRLHGVDFLGSQLVQCGIDATEINWLAQLGDLSREEVKELAEHVLGAEQERFVARLVPIQATHL
ncbi:MAG: hypothetical protein ACKV0T_05395 [Planctomycetales bacterium]